MACFYPLSGFYVGSPEGGYRVVFDTRNHEGKEGTTRAIQLPCGQCVGCRLERSRQWAMRCLHEASLRPDNCFLTLTYSDESLPVDGSLNYKHVQKFLRALRKKVGKIRFFACGEYGEDKFRPHYHLLIFGYDFPDKVKIKLLKSNCTIYRSKMLEELWKHGNSSIGEVTFESAAYVARYCMKKITGPNAIDHYARVTDGMVTYSVEPEFAHMSLKPGIGAEWLARYRSDVYPQDYVVVNGIQVKPPKYYDKLYAVDSPENMDYIKFERAMSAEVRALDNTPERLDVKAQVVKAKVNRFKRDIT